MIPQIVGNLYHGEGDDSGDPHKHADLPKLGLVRDVEHTILLAAMRIYFGLEPQQSSYINNLISAIQTASRFKELEYYT